MKKNGKSDNLLGGGSLPLATASSPSVAVSSATPSSGGHPRSAPGDIQSLTSEHAIAEWKLPIPKGWRCLALAECTVDGNISYGIVQPGMHDPDGVPIIRINDIENGHLNLVDVLKVSKAIEEKFKKTRLCGGEVLLTLVGSTGQSFVAPVSLEGWNVPRAIAVIRAKQEIGAKWINLCLQTKESKQYLDERANTTVQKTLNLKDVRNLPILIPPSKVKDRIENIILSIDDKITLNRRINQTLEAMAQALFQSWFVDFDPVKAKQKNLDAGGTAQAAELAAMQVISGKSPAQLKAFQKQQPEQYAELERTAKLFPSKLVESELGLIPEGWEWKSAAQIADVGIGKTPPRNESQWFSEDSNDVKWVSIRDMGESGAYIISTNERLTEASVIKFNVRRIPKNTVLLSFKMTLGRVAITTEEMLSNEAIAHFNLIEGTSIEAEYVYLYLKTFDYNSLGSTSSIATAVNSKIIKEMPILVPKSNVIHKFEEKVKPMFAKMLIKQNENTCLIESRDSLLPKLLSGEIDVSEIDIEANT